RCIHLLIGSPEDSLAQVNIGISRPLCAFLNPLSQNFGAIPAFACRRFDRLTSRLGTPPDPVGAGLDTIPHVVSPTEQTPSAGGGGYGQQHHDHQCTYEPTLTPPCSGPKSDAAPVNGPSGLPGIVAAVPRLHAIASSLLHTVNGSVTRDDLFDLW